MRGTNDRTFDSYGAQTVAHHRLQGGWATNEVELGVRFHTDAVARDHSEVPTEMIDGRLERTDGDRQTVLDSRTSAQALAIHLHDDLGMGPVHLLPGVRYEHITTAAGTGESGPEDPTTRAIWLPGIGVYGQVTDWLMVLGGAHRGFSPVPPGSPEESVPETAWNYEAGVRADYLRTHGEVIGFWSDYDNLTGQCTLSGGCTADQLDVQFNGGAATVYGVETVFGQSFSLPAGLTLGADLSYAWTHGEFETTFLSEFPQFGLVEAGDLLPNVPAHQGSVGLWLEHDKARLAVTTWGRSEMRDEAGQDPVPEQRAIPASVQTDVAVEYNFNSHFSAYATANNITGTHTIESWRPYGARPVAPFRAMVGLKAKL